MNSVICQFFTNPISSNIMNSKDKKWSEKEVLETFGDEFYQMTTQEIEQRCRLLDNEIRVFRNEKARINHDETSMKEKIRENNEKIKLNKQLPYLVANVVEVSFNFSNT